MKIITSVVIIIALVLALFNFTQINFEKPFEGNSTIAIIGIVASLCAVVLLLIFRLSKVIEEKIKK